MSALRLTLESGRLVSQHHVHSHNHRTRRIGRKAHARLKEVAGQDFCFRRIRRAATETRQREIEELVRECEVLLSQSGQQVLQRERDAICKTALCEIESKLGI